MADLNEQRLEIANQVHAVLGKENILTASQARLFVRCLQLSWDVPLNRWGERESNDQFRDAKRLLHVAGIFRQTQGRNSPHALDCYRRAGELLEWLVRSGEGNVAAEAPIELLAAGAYQLGGLPAMATGLLRQVDDSEPGAALIAAFLGGDFDSVVSHATEFWVQHPSLTSVEGARGLLDEQAEDRFEWHITVELVRGVGLFSDALRRGNDIRLNQALSKLKALANYAARTCSEAMSALLNLINDSAEGYVVNSIYAPANALASLNNDFAGRLQLFAREQFSRARGTLWPSQQRGLSRLLESSSFALCTPTGSGKTLVANFALLKELLVPVVEGPAPLALYLVPSRALAGEVESKLSSELGRDLIITGLYGGADWGITDYWINSNKPSVLIATVEKADALMRYAGPLLLSRLRLLIVDEAHQVVADDTKRGEDSFAEHNNRSIRLESFVSRLLARKPNIVRIALTAVAGGAAQPVADWIEGSTNAVPVGANYRSTRQLVGALEVSPTGPGRIVLDHLNGQPLFVRNRQEPVFIGLRFQQMPKPGATIRNSLNHFNQLQVLWTGLQLVEGRRRILISVMQSPERTMKWYAEALNMKGWEGLGNPAVHGNATLSALFQEARETCIDYCGVDSHELALLDRGIVTSHGQMPQRLRRLMVSLIERKVCAIAVATATLTEGVNLPFDLIFLTSLQRSSFDEANAVRIVNEMPTAEFRNLAGRAGRPGSADGMEGMILVALPQTPSTTAKSQRASQGRQIAELNQNYSNLLGRLLAEERAAHEVVSPLGLLIATLKDKVESVLNLRAPGDFLRWLEVTAPLQISDEAGSGASSAPARLADTLDELDSILLNSIEELKASADELLPSQVESLLAEVWKTTFTAVVRRSEEWLEAAFIKRGVAVVTTLYPDADERKRLYQYGFTPIVGRRFEKTATILHSLVADATNYGIEAPEQRLQLFKDLAMPLVSDRGFGFKTQNSVSGRVLMSTWPTVLGWWMNVPSAHKPTPDDLRSWQRFVSENLEFRLGVALGAVASQAWAKGIDDPLKVPSLAEWKEATGLPWIGFWAKELLRWGTLEPFVAFAMTQALAKTRTAAEEMLPQFKKWLVGQIPSPQADDFIDPQLFLAWQQSLELPTSNVSGVTSWPAKLSGTNGAKFRYDVVPLRRGSSIDWIDAAGYKLAESSDDDKFLKTSKSSDFVLRIKDAEVTVERTFVAR
ncbi:DEAD/DEAH box helicase [Massilia soli]|uniref:DEAD/DEAH box helicase n=1 Tax=Massilia soli TaxID=2792854 RepID=A0ABS7SJ76_9BURK|nr:DEAD/DEAH box helicase [Massilia soli]MBZ2206261.1 DEAD/DEAH box helicase [Massilia soli]